MSSEFEHPSLEEIQLGPLIVEGVVRSDGVTVSARYKKCEEWGDVPGFVTIQLKDDRKDSIHGDYPIHYSGDDVRLIGAGDLVKGARMLVFAYLNSSIDSSNFWSNGGPLLIDHMEHLGGHK